MTKEELKQKAREIAEKAKSFHDIPEDNDDLWVAVIMELSGIGKIKDFQKIAIQEEKEFLEQSSEEEREKYLSDKQYWIDRM